jgi:hypothetical protein
MPARSMLATDPARRRDWREHAAESGRTVVTRDAAARFHELPGVHTVVLS